MESLVVKSLHIIFVVTWFAGLFYMVRLLIYNAEALKKEEPAKSILVDQFQIMQRRLWYIIAVPSMVITLILGTWLLILNPHFFFKSGDYFPVFMHIKLTLVLLLVGYHHYIGAIYKKMKNGTKTYSSLFLRILNEVATLFLFAIVFLIELKNKLVENWMWSLLCFAIFTALVFYMLNRYKKKREKLEDN